MSPQELSIMGLGDYDVGVDEKESGDRSYIQVLVAGKYAN